MPLPTHRIWQEQCDIGKSHQQSDQNGLCEHKGDYASKNGIHWYFRDHSTDDEDVHAYWRGKYRQFGHDSDEHAKPYGAKAESFYDGDEDGEGEDDHSKSVHEAPENKIN